MQIFKNHGMNNVAYFAPVDEPLSKNTLIYILSFPNRDAAKKSWDAFRSDPEWQKVQKESEVNGKLELSTVQETVTVTGESPVVDTKSTTLASSFTKDMLEKIPNARDPWVIIEQTPGMVMSGVNVGERQIHRA